MSSLGLVLSGGGARAAYQAGVLAAISDISSSMGITNPFDYYTGVSAGAINATKLASEEDFHKGTHGLVNLWNRVTSDDVYISDPVHLSLGGIKWLTDLSFGAIKPTSPRRALLSTDPLYDFIKKNIEFKNIAKNIEDKKFRALAISALDYYTSSTVTFIQGLEEIQMWQRVRRQSMRSSFTADHVLASASIPLLFPPVEVDNRFFGDGSIRNLSPCGPSIYMGAQRLIAIGVRKKQEVCFTADTRNGTKPPTVGRVVNVLLHAVMMDGIEIDIERMDRINAGLKKISEQDRTILNARPIEYLWIAPSRDMAQMASDKVSKLPQMIRYLLKGLGSLEDASEITSFLLFDPAYCGQLTELGFEDGMREKENITRILSGDQIST